jgi:hypothetical protein
MGNLSIFITVMATHSDPPPPQILQAYSDYVGGIDMSNVVMYAWIDEWMGTEILEKYLFQLTIF